MEKIAELKEDVAELESLLSKATRQSVKDILSIQTRKLVTEIVKLEATQKDVPPTVTSPSSENASKCYQVKLNNYGWDQTEKFVKFYVTLPKVQDIPAENVSCKFTSKSLELNVKNLANKDYVLIINKLLMPIDPSTSNWKIKTDMVIINVAKSETGTNWSHVTELEKKASDAKKPTPDMDKSDNPTDGLMSIMRNMYEQGDDDMKRTIAKAWTESQNKKPEF